MSRNKGWYGADLDSTLAYYEKWNGNVIGEPIPKMVERVKKWLASGRIVKIFTARVWTDGSPERNAEVEVIRNLIQDWCLTHIGQKLEVTNIKDFEMIELWDDRCVRVEANTGERIL